MIALNGHKLSLAEVWHLVSLQSTCELAPEARSLIRRGCERIVMPAEDITRMMELLQSETVQQECLAPKAGAL